MQKIRRFVGNLSLIRKILIILLLSLLPVILVAFLGSMRISAAYSELLYHSVAYQLSSSAREISKQLEDIEALSALVYSHDTVQNGLYVVGNSDNDMMRSDANAAMRSLLTNYGQNYRNRHVSYINLYSGNFWVSGNSYASNNTPAAVLEAAREQAAAGEGAVTWYTDPGDTGHLFLGRAVRQVKNLSLAPLGEQIICIDIAAMVQEATQFNDEYEQAQYLILNGDGVLYTTEHFSVQEALDICGELNGKYKVIRIGANNYFAVSGSIPYYGWDYLCLVPFDGVIATLNRVQTMFVSLLILCTVAVVLLAHWLITSLGRHFQILIQKMQAVGEDASCDPKLTDYDYHDRTDEIGVLHQQFDRMAARIRHLIQINYVTELLKKEAQLKALENQINPHFLYNTLESVNWRAKARGAEDISVMVQSLAALLRVTLSQSETIFTLQQELDLVKSYMSIQEYRFEDRLVFSINVPPELLPIPIVKLTIQPLVENAIHYGLEQNTEGCEITVSARMIGDKKVQILVTNTDSVFEDGLLEKLRRGEVAPHGHGIGLLNIDKRLKMTYGEEFGLTLYNQDECAVAAVTIPAEGRGEEC